MTEYHALAVDLMAAMEQVSRIAPYRMIQEHSKGEIFLLSYLYNREGTARPGEMSTAMEVSTARVAAAINSMQRKGWVLRETDPEDHRKALVHLTPQGRELYTQCRGEMLDGLVRILTALGPQQAEEYVGLVLRLTQLHIHAQKKLEME